jgi:hypothetical protein
LRRVRSALTLLALFFILLIASGIPAAYAWSIHISPSSRSVPPGGTTSFLVDVTGTIAGNPNVQLLVSPPVLGISASFTTNNVPAPFTSTMYVTVDPSKAPGSYVLEVWAHPAGVPFPGPGNEYVNVHMLVGAAFDFSLALSPASVTVKQGDTANYQIFITYSDPSYSGTSITVQVAGLGPGMNYQIIPSPPSLSISTSQSTPTGTYTILLTGSAMGVVHQTSALLTVQPAEQPFDFSISAAPTQQTVNPGASATYTITVGLVSGTSQNVALTASSTLQTGISESLNPTSGLPSYNAILTISTTSSLAPGQYSLTITGTGGGKTHPVTVTLTVAQAPDFRIDVSPSSQTALQGQTTSYSVNVVGLNGFNSQVSLSVAGLPAGVVSVFTVPSSLPDYSSTLTLTIPGDSPTGSFALTITGSGGGLTRDANVILMVNPSQTQSQTTSTQTTTSSTGGLLETLQQNSLIVIGLLVLLVILLAVLAMRGRGGGGAVPQQAGAPRVFCGKCGTQNPASNEFCASCGNKLKTT